MNIKSIIEDKEAHIIGLYGKTDVDMIKAFDQQFKQMLEANKTKAYILITSAGGPNDIGRGLCVRLRLLSKSYHLIIVGVGTVMSQAVNMLVSVPLERRFLTSGTIVMIHQTQDYSELKLHGSLATRVEVSREHAVDMMHYQKDYDRMIGRLSESTGITIRKLKQLARFGTYMEAEEAVKLGFASAIIEE